MTGPTAGSCLIVPLGSSIKSCDCPIVPPVPFWVLQDVVGVIDGLASRSRGRSFGGWDFVWMVCEDQLSEGKFDLIMCGIAGDIERRIVVYRRRHDGDVRLL